jgi:hypothetical protein
MIDALLASLRLVNSINLKNTSSAKSFTKIDVKFILSLEIIKTINK